MYRVWNFLSQYSLLLIAGALLALVWANTDYTSYHHFIETELWRNPWIGVLEHGADGTSERVLTLHFLINDVFMALFFAMAGKEVWEAVILKNGSLRGRKALSPLIATVGGMLGPITIYLGLAYFVWPDSFADFAHGWAIPTATDIAFSYLIGRMVFGAGHPAVRFLLLLAIADDAGGLIILAIFYPSGDLAPAWLLMSFAAATAVYVLANWLPLRLDGDDPEKPVSTWVRDKLGFWPYAVAGAVSWYGFQLSGIHPALGLLPIVVTIPHADRAFGIYSSAQKYLGDMLNRIEHSLKIPVEIVLFLFGLSNAGVLFSAIGEATWLVLLGLIIGKPLGIWLFGTIASGPMKLGLPVGMKNSDLIVLGCVAAIGFTVALFVASVAFDAGPVQDAAKMGALFSFGAAVIALLAGKLFRIQKVE